MRQHTASSYEVLQQLPGALTQIDVKATLKQQLGVNFRRYKNFGACNPPLAHRALTAELEIGVMLPCNVIVYKGDDGRAFVLAVDPMRSPLPFAPWCARALRPVRLGARLSGGSGAAELEAEG